MGNALEQFFRIVIQVLGAGGFQLAFLEGDRLQELLTELDDAASIHLDGRVQDALLAELQHVNETYRAGDGAARRKAVDVVIGSLLDLLDEFLDPWVKGLLKIIREFLNLPW